jgi:RNA binding exosome subunit
LFNNFVVFLYTFLPQKIKFGTDRENFVSVRTLSNSLYFQKEKKNECELHLPQKSVSLVEVSFFAHATEDENKVITAAKNLLPATQRGNISFSKNNLRGHHGNPITLFQTEIKDKETLSAVVENLAHGLSPLDKEKLLREAELHVEKGSLYLRFDKQAAFRGEFKLSVSDPIRVRLRLKKHKLEDVVQLCREIGLFP